MQNDSIKRPDLVEGWLDNIKGTWQKHGVVGLVPWWVLLFLIVGGGASLLTPLHFYETPDLSIPFYVGILTVDGLFLAFSWSSFIKIYEAAAAPKFANYLRRNGLLTRYFFHVDYIHITQVGAVIVAAASLVLTIINGVPGWGHRICFALTIATLLYALRYALGAVRIMQDIVWYRAIFDSSLNETKIVNLHDGGR